MKKLLLIGPPSKSIRTGQYLSPPLGVYRLESYLKDCLTRVIDPNVDDVSESLSDDYDFIGYSILHPTIEQSIRIIFKAYELNPDALHIAGGQGASFNNELLLNKTPINVIVRGLGEKQLERIIKGDEINDIPGLHYKSEGVIKSTELLNVMSLNEFSQVSLSTDFSLIPYEKYWDVMMSHYNKSCVSLMKNDGMIKTIRLITSNYCPMGCTFCSSTNFLNESCIKTQKLLQLSPENIMIMINNAVKSHPSVESFYFHDDNFMINSERLKRFCDLIGNKYNLMCQGRVDNANPELLMKMSESNFKIIFYGVETFSNRLASTINKDKSGNYECRAVNSVLETLNAGITPQFSLILFLPETRVTDLETTINNSVKLISEGARVTVFPFIEAYSGTTVINSHEVINYEFNINGDSFRIPYLVIPDDEDIRLIAKESLDLKESLNKDYNHLSVIPQVIDSLNLFKAVYTTLGNDSLFIDDCIKSLLDKRNY